MAAGLLSGTFTLARRHSALMASAAIAWGMTVGAYPNRMLDEWTTAATERSIEDSLKRLGIDRLDIVWVHDIAQDFHGDLWLWCGPRTGRVRTWQAGFHEYRRTEKQRRGGRRVDPIDAYTSVPRPSPVTVWTPAQIRLFLEEAQRHRLFALYRLIALRGLRRGEACGLRWKEVDVNGQALTVNWQLVQLAWQVHGAPPRPTPPCAPSPWTPKPWPACRPSACTTCATAPHRSVLAAGAVPFWPIPSTL
ncbi:hypothetical protein OHA25_23125 [Nonomuraea sp. NBC_00507]|uniref:hypothetical protein n=1 Tax=Nonomuraea sp. NBC_00507 TaxID=2976002 RepID=UPI002E1865CA